MSKLFGRIFFVQTLSEKKDNLDEVRLRLPDRLRAWDNVETYNVFAPPRAREASPAGAKRPRRAKRVTC